MEENNESISKDENEINEYTNEYANEYINEFINEEPEKLAKIENYSLKELLESPSCLLSKEKAFLWKNSLFSKKLYEILTTEDNQIISRYKKLYNQIENIQYY